MMIAALLPPYSVDQVRRLLPGHYIRATTSWGELDAILGTGVRVGVFDPSVRGFCNTSEALRLLNKHHSASLFAYVTPTAENLKSVFLLSKGGLRYVFVRSIMKTDLGFRNAVEKAACDSLATSMLAVIESRIATLPASTARAVTDLFERPDRYEVAQDLALEAEVPVKNLYRQFSRAGLRTPKQLVVFAKAVQGYDYLRCTTWSLSAVSRTVGYTNPKLFAGQLAAIFNCTLPQLRNSQYYDQLVLRLIEWLHKPA